MQHFTNEAAASSTSDLTTADSTQLVNGTLSNDVVSTGRNLTEQDMAVIGQTERSSLVDGQQQQQHHEQLSVVPMRNKSSSPLDHTPEVELAQTSEDLEATVTTEETVYTTGIPGGPLDDESLIQVNVNVSQTPSSAITSSSGENFYIPSPGNIPPALEIYPQPRNNP